MTHVVGIQRMTLKPGINADEFEKFMTVAVFPTLFNVFQRDNMITHDFRESDWLDSKQCLLRGNQSGEYLRIVIASCDGSKARTEEGRAKLHADAQAVASEIFDAVPHDATGKLKSLVTQATVRTFIEMVRYPLPEAA